MPAWLVLVIVLEALLAAYFVLGMVVRYRGGKRSCPEIIPNYSFWRGAAGRVSGCIACLATCGRERGEAADVKPDEPEMAGLSRKAKRRQDSDDVLYDIDDGSFDWDNENEEMNAPAVV
jgi:hypothetical protein